MSHVVLRTTLSALAALLIVLHLLRPELEVDSITLGLAAIMVLPWFSVLLKSVELPGGLKLEFPDLEKAVAQITEGAGTVRVSAQPAASDVQSSLIRTDDANLALVAMRIEIEKRLRKIAPKHDIPGTEPLAAIVRRLRTSGVLSSGEAGGLERVIMAGNKAAHGVQIDPDVASYANAWGLAIIDFLDRKLAG